MIIIYSTLILFFLSINYLIIKSDIEKKIIPNKHLIKLLYLLPIFYIFLYFNGNNLDLLNIIVQFLITFIVSFLLYFYGIWSAGDSKYILILSLYIPQFGIIPFIGNISLISIIYLLLFFIYFYLGKSLYNLDYGKSLIKNIKKDLFEKWSVYKSKKGGTKTKAITNWFIFFIVIFLSIRLFRISIFDELIQNNYLNIDFIENIIKLHPSYFTLGTIFLFLAIVYIFKKIIIKIKNYIIKKYNTNENNINNYLLSILLFILIFIIGYEYINNKENLLKHLYIIFTFYIFIYFIFQVLIYTYKITFGIAEQEYINICKLKKNHIIDKIFILKIIGDQEIFKKEETIKKYNFLYGGVKLYIEKLDNPIDIEGCRNIKKMFKLTNKYHKDNKTPGYSEINQIRISKTFAFGPYIFLGFIITYLYSNELILKIIEFLIEIIKRLVFY